MFALNLHVLLLIIGIILGCAAFAALSSCGELHVYALFVFINFWSLFMECE